MSKVSEARMLAYKALERVRKDGAFANDVIDKVVDMSDASPADKAFATRLVLGVVSTSGSLDAIYSRFVTSPGSVKGKLRGALRIATYEIAFLGKDPYAAVDQCVELAKTVQPRAAGLANAVMRKVAASMEDFPYGDPVTDIDAYALEHGFPAWLVGMLRERLQAEAGPFIEACNGPAPIFIHVNSLKDDGHVLDRLKAIEPEIEQCEANGRPITGCYNLPSSKAVAKPEFIDLVEEGKVLVTDASAQLIVQMACNTFEAQGGGGLSCLELCAGRGTKTILLQSVMSSLYGSQFERFISVDNVPFKAALLRERARLFGADLTESICADATSLAANVQVGPGFQTSGFDLVFLDAPCTGLGTMRRHPEIRWRLSKDTIAKAAALDQMLIKEAASHVAPGGTLAYSTCTVTKEEDEDVIASFLHSPQGEAFGIIPINGMGALRTKLVENGPDAHFCALLRREAVI